MPDVLVGLVDGEELQKVYNSKSKPYDEKTIGASSLEALELKVAGEKADGWEVLRENARSVRLYKNKSIDRQLEDDIWCMLYRMGFKTLNEGRQFLIQTGPSAPARQLDVFAKDDETAIIVECTHSKEAGSKSVKALIDKICGFRQDVINAVHKQFGKDPKLKVKFAIATRNVEWRKADRDRATENNIGIIDDSDFEYYEKLTGLLKHAARYQFLGRYFFGEKVEGLRTQVPATKGFMGGTTFYNFVISPHDLLKISYISHRSAVSNDDFETYQRMVKGPRLKAIGAYIDDGGKFPTNIVINLKIDGKLNFDPKEKFDDTSTGILTLPGKYGSAWVIDGQHRLYGYAHASRGPESDKSVITVLAYENLPIKDEIKLFVDINTQQVRVQRALVEEIISGLNIEDPDPKRQLDALLARTALQLNKDKRSPIKGRIATTGQERTAFRCLSLPSISDGMGSQSLLGTIHRQTASKTASIKAGRLSDATGDPKASMEKAVKTVSLYLNLFASQVPSHWELGDAKGGFLCTNNGIRALLQVFRRVMAFAEHKEGANCESLDAEDIIELVEPYVQPVVDFFKTADASSISRFRNRGSSLQSVDQNCFQMLSLIHEAKEDFRLPEVVDYMASRDVEGTKEAKDMIDEMNKIIYDDVLERLQAKYGLAKDKWWLQGVPSSIRKDCDARYNDQQGEHDRWQFLTFANYSDIVIYSENWDLFKDHYNFMGKGKKATLVRWLGRLNKARTVTHHAEKGPLSKVDVEFVREVYVLVKKHIGEGEKLVTGKRYLSEPAPEPSPEEAAASSNAAE
ncbi:MULTISPECIES: DGQHR domain-containing protein [Methylobacterium]|uniref:DGQHR domain-containing protein n=1 Tax=Methylobacterium TaxID=407 RepID=UPI00272E9E05|nr:DGQHR domain-containing protein [Methylobacterium sp.]